MSYLMIYVCWNCKSKFTNKIQDAVPALGKGGICPICKIPDGYHTEDGPEWHNPYEALDISTL